MDEMNKLPEDLNSEKIEEQIAPAPKALVPKLPLIIGGVVVGVAAIVVTVALILGGGNNNQGGGNTPDENEHEHSYGEWTVVDKSTCTVAGVEERVCECGEKETRPVAALGHTEVVDSAVDATCTSTGLTEGKHCSICNKVIVAQNTVEMKPHVEEIDEAVEATCTTTGLTEGKHCSVCNTVIIAQNIIPASHKYSDIYEYNDEYHWLKCTVCGEKNTSSHITDDEAVCSLCNHIVSPTSGIIYDISADGTYALVVAYTGTAKNIRIADTYEGLPVKNIYDKVFYNKDTITSVIIPDGVTYIGNEAFYSCDSLSSVIIPDSVTYIGNEAFSSSDSLSSVVIGDSVTYIGNEAFLFCNSLSSVVIGDSVTSIGNKAFYSCSRLSSVIIPDSVTSIGNEAFSSCSRLSTVVIGESVASIGAWAFSKCSKLQFNEYGNCKYLGSKNNPYFVLIGPAIENMSSYTIHEDTKVIVNQAFYNCSRLTSIVIPDSVTFIGICAFYGCDSLSSVVIGNGVASIGGSAFVECSSLKDIYYTGSKEEWNVISIENNYELASVTIHYNYVPNN